MGKNSELKNTIVYIAGLIKYVAVLVVIVGLLSVVFAGVRFLSGVLIPVLSVVSAAMIMVMIFMLVLSSIVRKYVTVTSFALLIFSYFFGITAWFLGLASTLHYFGFIWVVIGVFMLGIGVVPIGLLALAVNEQWWNFATLLILLIVAYKARNWALKSGIGFGRNTSNARRGRVIDAKPDVDYDKPRKASYRVIESDSKDNGSKS